MAILLLGRWEVVGGVIRLTRCSQHNETMHSVQTYFIYLTAISMGQTRFGLAQE